jgi:hypothetical protein
MLKRVTKDVRQQTNERQRPERLSKLTIEFYFNENKLRVTTENEAIREETSRETTGAIRSSEAMEVWTVIKETRDKEILKAYIDRYSETFYATLAKRRIAKLEEAERKTVVTPSPNKTVNTPAAPKIKLPSSQPISANCKVSLESWRTKASIGAFALSKEGACGWSWRHKTESDARNAAMEYCKKYGTECKVIDVHTDQPGDYSLTNECRTKLTEWHKKSSLAAFAVSRDGACGWSFNYDTMQGAEKRALKECANQGPECKVIQTR